MGAEESRIKDIPSLQVKSLLSLFWNLNYKDQKHFMELLQDEDTQLKILHQYHEIDIPLPIWGMFASTQYIWSVNQLMTDRWKELYPYFKGIAINKENAIAFCTTKELVNVDLGEKSMEEVIFKLAEFFPKMEWSIKVEYKSCVYGLEEFLKNGTFYSYSSEEFVKWVLEGENEDDGGDLITFERILKRIEDEFENENEEDSSSEEDIFNEREQNNKEQEKWDKMLKSLM